MKHLNEEWCDLIVKTKTEIRYLEEYIMTEKGAHEAVEWLLAMFAFCLLDSIWAAWNLWHLLISAIL